MYFSRIPGWSNDSAPACRFPGLSARFDAPADLTGVQGADVPAITCRKSRIRARQDGPLPSFGPRMYRRRACHVGTQGRGERRSAIDYIIPPESEYLLRRGMIIPATLYTSIDSTIGGTVIAYVNQDIYDSRHRTIVVPRGSKLTGSFGGQVVQQGQARIPGRGTRSN